MRTFETGATRDSDEDKLDFEGFISPLVWLRFAEYMHEHRIQPDGSLRASDNWQKGMPLEAFMSSGFRHFMDLWLNHRGHGNLARENVVKTLCGIMFNVQGYLHELLVAKLRADKHDAADTGLPISRDEHANEVVCPKPLWCMQIWCCISNLHTCELVNGHGGECECHCGEQTHSRDEV